MLDNSINKSCDSDPILSHEQVSSLKKWEHRKSYLCLQDNTDCKFVQKKHVLAQRKSPYIDSLFNNSENAEGTEDEIFDHNKSTDSDEVSIESIEFNRPGEGDESPNFPLIKQISIKNKLLRRRTKLDSKFDLGSSLNSARNGFSAGLTIPKLTNRKTLLGIKEKYILG